MGLNSENMKDDQLDLLDTDVSTDVSDYVEEPAINLSDSRSEKNSNHSAGNRENVDSSEERKKKIRLLSGKFNDAFTERLTHGLMESPQAPTWPIHGRQCPTSTPQPVIMEEEFHKNVNDEYSFIQRKTTEIDNLLRIHERSHAAKKNKYQKIISCYKQINSLLENAIQDIQSDTSNGTKDDPEKLKNGKPLDFDQNNGILKKIDNFNEPSSKLTTHTRTFFEKYLCSLAITYDERKDQVTSVAIEQMNRITVDGRLGDIASVGVKHSKTSSSSGSLADHSSLSDSNSVHSFPKLPFQLPGRHSIPESSSTSSSSSIQRNLPSRHSHQFTVPSTSDKLVHHNRAKTCYCKCFCSLLKSNFIKSSFESISAVHDHSVENSKCDVCSYSSKDTVPQNTEEFFKGISCTSSERNLPVEKLGVNKRKELSEKESQTDNKQIIEIKTDQLTLNKPEINIQPPQSRTRDLLVFGRWLNKYYPGKIEGVTEEDWHNADTPLKVIFFDGLPKFLANVFIIPAKMLPIGIEIKCSVGSNLYEQGSLVEIQSVANDMGEESLNYTVNIDNTLTTLSFEKVWFNELTRKQLGVTPRKPKVGTPWNVVEGKRQRSSLLTKVAVVKDSQTLSERKKSVKKPKIVPVSEDHVEAVEEKSNTDTVLKQSESLKRTRRNKSSSDEGSIPRKLAKKLEFEPQPGTSCTLNQRVPRETPKPQSSETESTSTDLIRDDFIEVSDLDTEYVPVVDTWRKSFSTRRTKSIKSSDSAEEEDSIISELGPVQKSTVFKGYNFVLTHALKEESSCKQLMDRKIASCRSSVSGTENESCDTTDVEDQLENCPSFDYTRLKMQIKAGGGILYDSVVEIHKTEYSRTITISDYPCQTPNYLLSIALGIAIYRHDLIINCCKENVAVSKMIQFSYHMPYGRSFENGKLIDIVGNKSKKPLTGLSCAVYVRNSFKFWRLLLSSMGASVVCTNRSVAGFASRISFIVTDRAISKEDYVDNGEEAIPLLSKQWVVQTLIHGEPRPYLEHSQYVVKYT